MQNMEESRSAFQELSPQTLGMPAQRTVQVPVPNAGLLPTQMWGQPSAPMPGRMSALMAAQMSPHGGRIVIWLSAAEMKSCCRVLQGVGLGFTVLFL